MKNDDSDHSIPKQDSDYIEIQNTTMKLTHSASDQNGFYTYMCQLNDVKPSDIEKIITRCYNRSSRELIDQIDITQTDDGQQHLRRLLEYVIEKVPYNPAVEIEIMEDEPRHIERSQALHQLEELNKEGSLKETDVSTAYPSTTTAENSEYSEIDDLSDDINNPNVLKLTKMKWLTENQPGTPDSRSPSLSPTRSFTDSYTTDSEENIGRCISFGEKCLSTILRLDKEHNMFGLSNITIIDSKMSKKSRKGDDGPAFPQTTIIQVCCGRGCCKHKSNTDLPTSLKCRKCYSCADPSCAMCTKSCGPPCNDTPCSNHLPTCEKGKCHCKSPCLPSKCLLGGKTCFGMKISLTRKPKYEPSPVEITPRSSCILQKPQAARSCHHLPRCTPPSSCFPYLSPCYWPPRASAPCNSPARCFHNPPCLPPRIKQTPIPSEYMCPHDKKCINEDKKTKCPNPSCPGNNPTMKKEIENRFGNTK